MAARRDDDGGELTEWQVAIEDRLAALERAIRLLPKTLSRCGRDLQRSARTLGFEQSEVNAKAKPNGRVKTRARKG